MIADASQAIAAEERDIAVLQSGESKTDGGIAGLRIVGSVLTSG